MKSQNLRFFLKDDNNQTYSSFQNLKKDLKSNGKTLVFAMNGGMYTKEKNPLGLYIEDYKVLKKQNKVQEAFGNFYMQPNGIFYINSNNEAFVTTSTQFKNDSVKYATQSGPMLLINGNYHPKFIYGSENLNIRNGVGILPNGNVLFAISKEKVNFYDFATFFKTNGCKNALYLDGFVSKAYIPSKNSFDLSGNFGVIIAETEKNKQH